MSKGYEPLSAAIIERALLDYKQALSEKDEGTIRECERFLRSQWFAFLSDFDGKKLIAIMRGNLHERILESSSSTPQAYQTEDS